jgi:hypothetical protein
VDGRSGTGLGCGTLRRVQIPTEATRQRGRFTYEQALRAGATKADVDTARRRGEVVRLRHDVYVAAGGPVPADDREQHLDDLATEQLALGPHWYAARRSAAVVWDVPVLGRAPRVPQLLADPGQALSSARDRHRRLAPLPTADRAAVEGAPVVSLARLVADVARAEPFRNAVVVADAVLGRGVPRAELERCLAGMRRWPGVVAARRAVAFADGRAESPLESISRVAIHERALPAPELQVEVWLGDRFLSRVDKLWRKHNTVGEADGLTKYGDDPASIAAALEQEKVRGDWMQDVGLEVARWTWEHAWRPEGVLDARLRQAFARGQQQRLDPRVRFVPTTVADRLRRDGRLPLAA